MDPSQEESSEPTRRRTVDQQGGGGGVHPSQGKENQGSSIHGLENRDKLCHGCQESMIKSRHLINLAGQQQHWHPECFKCTVCQLILSQEDSCHIYKEKIICRDDYAKLQREILTKCARCRWPVAASDWVRRAGNHVYHLACFTCDLCMRQLSTGEQFTLSSEEPDSGSLSGPKLICRLHFAINREPPTGAGGSSSRQPSPLNGIPQPPFMSNYNTSSNICQQQHATTTLDRNKFSAEQYLHFLVGSQSGGPSGQHQQPLEPACVMDNSLDESQCLQDLDTLEPLGGASACSSESSLATGAISGGGGSGGGGGSSKSKRVRTTFTEDQLSILQTHFQIDSNPDGQDLERIATITGLSKRVTQVWFQNSRARQKKYMIKRKPNVIGSGVSSSNCGPPSASVTSDHNTTAPQFSGHLSASQLVGCQTIGWPPETSNNNLPQLAQPNSSCTRSHEPHLGLPSQQTERPLVEEDVDEAEGGDEEGVDDGGEDSEEEEVARFSRRHQDFRN